MPGVGARGQAGVRRLALQVHTHLSGVGGPVTGVGHSLSRPGSLGSEIKATRKCSVPTPSLWRNSSEDGICVKSVGPS